MARFEHLLFVCTHEREAASGKQSCGGRGAQKLLAALKDEVSSHKLKGRVRVVQSGCLNLCSKGCAVVALRAPQQQMSADGANHSPPAESWYTHLDAEDAPALFATQVLQNGQYEAHLEVMTDVESIKRM